MTQIYTITPTPAPRQTRADKWKQRPCVMRYRAFRDEVKKAGVSLPEIPCKITFYLEMPKSWSAKKKAAMNGQPHTQKPDIDNIFKSLSDAIYEDDSFLHSVWIEKRWSETPHIAIETINKGL
jgi:Holliday junction resolvase RusA-like endonuclease